jgi:hypothetical protein
VELPLDLAHNYQVPLDQPRAHRRRIHDIPKSKCARDRRLCVDGSQTLLSCCCFLAGGPFFQAKGHEVVLLVRADCNFRELVFLFGRGLAPALLVLRWSRNDKLSSVKSQLARSA